MQIKLQTIIFILLILCVKVHTNRCFGSNNGVRPLINRVLIDINGVGAISGSFERTAWTRQLYMQFLGIPYAESPSGNLRFKAPVARRPWQNTLDGTKFGRRCPEFETIVNLNDSELYEDLEDCLNLCVYTKCLASRRPVIVYIYASGFRNVSIANFPPRYLLERDIVLVVPQYRVGALGWLSSGTHHMPGNVAIADVLFALEWVKSHIHEFGGDADCITLMGQGAGAVIAGAIYLSPLRPQQLIHRCILQSGSILSNWMINSAPQLQTKKVCRELGCPNCQSSAAIFYCLKTVHVLDLLDVTNEYFFSPMVGDVLGIVPEMPSVLLRNFDRPLPLLTGFTKHDGSFIIAMLYDEVLKTYGSVNFMNVREFATEVLSRIGNESLLAVQSILSLLFSDQVLRTSNHRKALPAYFDLASVVYIKSPVISLAAHIAKNHTVRTFLYTFDYKGQHTNFGHDSSSSHYPFNGGIHHSDENIYLFSTHKLSWSDTEIAKKMITLWTTFAQGGVPHLKNIAPILHMKHEYGPYFHINKKVTIALNVLNEFRAAVNDRMSSKLLRIKLNF